MTKARNRHLQVVDRRLRVLFSWHNHKVDPRWQLVSDLPEGLPEKTLDSISLNGGTVSFAHGNAEANGAGVVGDGEHNHVSVDGTTSLGKRPLKDTPRLDSGGSREALPFWAGRVSHVRDYTLQERIAAGLGSGYRTPRSPRGGLTIDSPGGADGSSRFSAAHR